MCRKALHAKPQLLCLVIHFLCSPQQAIHLNSKTANLPAVCKEKDVHISFLSFRCFNLNAVHIFAVV